MAEAQATGDAACPCPRSPPTLPLSRSLLGTDVAGGVTGSKWGRVGPLVVGRGMCKAGSWPGLTLRPRAARQAGAAHGAPLSTAQLGTCGVLMLDEFAGWTAIAQQPGARQQLAPRLSLVGVSDSGPPPAPRLSFYYLLFSGSGERPTWEVFSRAKHSSANRRGARCVHCMLSAVWGVLAAHRRRVPARSPRFESLLQARVRPCPA